MSQLLFSLVIALVATSLQDAPHVDTELPRKVIFDFSPEESSDWQILNDGVMGGRSKGYVDIANGLLRFTGTTVTQGGGFTSVRTRVDINLAEYDGLELIVRGGGRSFEVALGDDGLYNRRLSRRALVNTTSDWQMVRVPFDALRTTSFGRSVSAPSIDLANIVRIGIYIVDGQDGPFTIEIDQIGAYRADSQKSK